MSIFDRFKKKDVEHIGKTPKFIEVSYDKKSRPVEVKPVDHQEEHIIAKLDEEDKKLLVQWLNAIYENVVSLREQPDDKNLEKAMFAISYSIEDLKQKILQAEPKKAEVDILPETEKINRHIEQSTEHILKSIHSSIITKEELTSILKEIIEGRKVKAERISKPNIAKMISPTIEKTLKVWLLIKERENVLIITDRKMMKLGRLFFNLAAPISKANLIIMEKLSKSGEEPDITVAEAMKVSDLIIILTYHSLSHTKAVREAAEKGARIASMPRVPLVSFINGGLTADYKDIKRLTNKIFNAVRDCERIRVSSENGTDVEFISIGRDWFIFDGNITPGFIGNLPAGEVCIAPIEESINGTIIFDSFELAKGRLGLVVESGVVKKIKGRVKKIRKIFKELGTPARRIGEFGIGCNPNARIIGNTLEDEKAFGTVHFGLGNNLLYGGNNDVQFHEDGIIAKPTVEIDGKIIIKNGKWMID